MSETTVIFLGISLLLYSLFGGIALGSGILSLFLGRNGRAAIDRAVGPSWELHHAWLLLVIAILFIGFPSIFYAVARFLYIPLILLLAGILLQSGVVAYRQYRNSGPDGGGPTLARIYRFSNLTVALFIGVTVGAAIAGRIVPEPETFYEGFIASWLNGFSILVGLFVACLFTFLAAVYAMGEAQIEQERKELAQAAKISTVAAVLSGGMVFFSGELSEVYLLSRFIYSPVAIVSVLLSAVLLPFLWRSIGRRKIRKAWILAGAELVLVLVAWFNVQNPVVVSLENDANLTFENATAPDSTLLLLVIGLGVIGLILLFYLMKRFKSETAGGTREG